MSKAFLDRELSSARRAVIGPSRPTLTARQVEILETYLFAGSDKAVAEGLTLGKSGLAYHWRQIHRCLGTVTRFQAGFAYAQLLHKSAAQKYQGNTHLPARLKSAIVRA